MLQFWHLVIEIQYVTCRYFIKSDKSHWIKSCRTYVPGRRANRYKTQGELLENTRQTRHIGRMLVKCWPTFTKLWVNVFRVCDVKPEPLRCRAPPEQRSFPL